MKKTLIEILYDIQTQLELKVEDAYRYYKRTLFGSKSTKTYEDGLLEAHEVIESYKRKLL